MVIDKIICFTFTLHHIQVILDPHSHSLDSFVGQKMLAVGQTVVESFFWGGKSMPLLLDACEDYL